MTAALRIAAVPAAAICLLPPAAVPFITSPEAGSVADGPQTDGRSPSSPGDPRTTPIYEEAVRWVRLGISPIPIMPNTKEPPYGFAWGVYTRRLPDASELYEWFVVQRWQLAITFGQINPDLAVLDCDSLGGGERLLARYPQMAAHVHYRSGSDKLKWIVRLPPGKRTSKYTITLPDGDRWEVRTANHYDVAPGSLHPDTGKPYAWIVPPWDGIGVLDLEAIGFHYKQPAEPDADAFFTDGDPLTEAETDHLIDALKPHWKPGRHHDLALAIAGYLAGYRVPEADAWQVVADLAAHGDGDRRDLARAVADTYAKAREGISVVGWARLTDRRDPLISRATANRLDLLMRGRRPDFRWDDEEVVPEPPPDIGFGDDEVLPAANDGHPWIINVRDLLEEPDEGDTWYADGLIQQHTVLWIAGPGKTYKSFLGMAILAALAGHVDVWGAFYVPAPVPVIYLQEESSRKFVRRRFRAIARGYGLDPAAFGDRLHVITNTRFRLDRDDDLRRLLDEAIDQTGAGVILFDPYRSLHRMDENSSDDMARLMDRFLWLRDRLGVTALVIHHFGKQDAEKRDRWDGDEMRGSSVLWASGDGGLLVHPQKEDDRVSIRLRLKEGRPPDTLLVGVTFGPDPHDDGGTVTFRLIQGGGTGLPEDILMMAVNSAYSALGKKRDRAWPTADMIANEVGLSARTVGPMLADLAAKGKISRHRRHKLKHLWAPLGAPEPSNANDRA